MKRLGTVLAFKEGIGEAEAKAALEQLAPLLEPMYIGDETYHLFKFNPEHGWPVWYIP